MKFYFKITGVILFVLSINYKAQKNFEVGVYGGIPTGDAAKTANFNLGLNIAYTQPITSSVNIGIASGISHFFEKKNAYKNINFIPLAIKGKYLIPNNKIALSLDLGYAFYPQQEFHGGFYSFPQVGYKVSSGELFLGYQFIGGRYTFTTYDPFTSQTLSTRLPFSVGSFSIGYNFLF